MMRSEVEVKKVEELAQELATLISDENTTFSMYNKVMESVVSVLLNRVYVTNESKVRFLHRMIGKYL